VSPALANDLRSGLLKELGAAAERLSGLALCGEVGDRHAYESALWTIEAAHKVLAKIGEGPLDRHYAVALSRNDHPYLVYRALKSQLTVARERAQDEAAEGRSARTAVSSELAAAVSALRREIVHSVTAKREAKLSGSPLGERVIPVHPSRGRG